jgi:hypothetical protein
VATDNGSGWRIIYSETDQVIGNIRTYNNGASSSTCGLNAVSFDWDFSVSIIGDPEPKSIIIETNEPENKPYNTPILIFPNPTERNVTISGDQSEWQTFRIFDVFGQDVTEQVKILNSNTDELILDLSKLNKGIFVIKMKSSINKIYKF